jgi:hypothetical protein
MDLRVYIIDSSLIVLSSNFNEMLGKNLSNWDLHIIMEEI